MSLCHFLIVYDLEARTIVSQRAFDNVADAVDAYAVAEQTHLVRDREDLEIVLIGADSIETVRHTHGSYFDGHVSGRSKYLAELG